MKERDDTAPLYCFVMSFPSGLCGKKGCGWFCKGGVRMLVAGPKNYLLSRILRAFQWKM